MKLTIRDDSKNYACTVVRLPVKQAVEGLDNLVKVTVFGNDVLVKKDADEECLYLFFPSECQISKEYLSANNEFRNNTLNKDSYQKGYFEENGRVKAIKFKGVISTGYLAPLSTLNILWKVIDGRDHTFEDAMKEGDEFTDINGVNICRKYKMIYQNTPSTKESRYNKKLQRFDKLVPNQFRFHTDTNHLAKHLHLFHPEDIVVITDKWHGTSAVFANVLINRKLSWLEKLALKFGVKVQTTQYDELYSSRSVLKNRYINEGATNGFYNEDIWEVVHNELKHKIEPGISLYGEIVGFLPSGAHIQRGYDYGCVNLIDKYSVSNAYPLGSPIPNPFGIYQHKFVIYRITYTKPDGNVIEFSWQQIKNYCKKYELEHVKELYFGKAGNLVSTIDASTDQWKNDLFNQLSACYLEKNCTWCVNKVPAEGICVRRDGLESYSTFKLKAKRFLERESKMLDLEQENIEDNA